MKEFDDRTACSFQFCAACARMNGHGIGNDLPILRQIAHAFNGKGTRRLAMRQLHANGKHRP
ncbi:hypothetical protein [Paraburkholderia dipogonis]|uniref:hypothetical protein n=1 Tax=Paraburkholderia dipogonis TaxID=1211383 RepID=UPI0038BDFC80